MSETDKVASQDFDPHELTTEVKQRPCGDDQNVTSIPKQASDDFIQLQKDNTLENITTERSPGVCDVLDQSDICEARPEKAGCDEHLSRVNSPTGLRKGDQNIDNSLTEAIKRDQYTDNSQTGVKIRDLSFSTDEKEGYDGQFQTQDSLDTQPKLNGRDEVGTDALLEQTDHHDTESFELAHPLNLTENLNDVQGATGNNSLLPSDQDNNNHSERAITVQKHTEESKSPLVVSSSADETEHELVSLENKWGDIPVKVPFSACATPEETERYHAAFSPIEPLTSNDFIMGSCSTGVTCLDEVSQTSHNGNPMELAMVKIHHAWHHIVNENQDWARKIMSEIIAGQDPVLNIAIYKVKSLLALLEANTEAIRKYTVRTLESLQVPFLPGTACNAAWVYVHEALAPNCKDPQYWFQRARDLFSVDTNDLSEAVCGENTATACMNIITNGEQGDETLTSDIGETIAKFYTNLAKHPVVNHVLDFSHMFL